MSLQSTVDRSGLACSPANTVTDLAATSVDANFPVVNLLDEHPKRIYRAADTVNTVTFSGEVREESATLCIFNTNAISATITIEDYAYGEWFTGNEWFADNEWWPIEIVNIPGEIFETGERNAMGIKFDPLEYHKTFSVILSSPADTTLEVGIFHTGVLIQTTNLKEGLTESQEDYSIAKILSNGTSYYKKRDIVRLFNGTVLDEFPEYTDNFLLDVSRAFGQKPMPWFITDIVDSRWLIYGKLATPVSVTYNLCNNAESSFSIKEVL